MSEDALVAREQRGNISVLTMVYRPYNLLGPKLINAIVEQIEEARDAGSRAIVLAQRPAAFFGRRRSRYFRQARGAGQWRFQQMKTAA